MTQDHAQFQDSIQQYRVQEYRPKEINLDKSKVLEDNNLNSKSIRQHRLASQGYSTLEMSLHNERKNEDVSSIEEQRLTKESFVEHYKPTPKQALNPIEGFPKKPESKLSEDRSQHTFDKGYSKFVFQSSRNHQHNHPTLTGADDSIVFLSGAQTSINGTFPINSPVAKYSQIANSVRLSQTNLETMHKLKKMRNTHLLNYKKDAVRRES